MTTRKQIKQTLGRKVGIGRFMMPAWGAAMGVVLIAAAAGQAVGPVLSGSTTGSVNLTVSQAITLATGTGNELGSNPKVAATDISGDVKDSATTRNDEGTNFTIAIEMTQGANAVGYVYLANHSGKDGAITVQLNVPAGIDVEVEDEGSDMNGVARLNANTWLGVVKAGAADNESNGLKLTIEPKDDLAPGFYTITGRIIQISG